MKLIFVVILVTYLGFCDSQKSFSLLMPHVYVDKSEAYLCTPIRLDDSISYYITKFTAHNSQHTAHHILIYGCEEPGAEQEVWNCGEMENSKMSFPLLQPCKSNPQIIYAWAKDAPPLQLPNDVGFRVGKNSRIQYLVLQVHYHFTQEFPKDGDDSGVILEYTSLLLPKMAGVIVMGTGGYAPPHTTTYFESSCKITDSRIFHPFAFRTHTHSLGKVVSGWKISGKSGVWKLLGKQNPQLPQMFYPINDTNMTFTSGDILASRCTMVNDRERITYIGNTKNDEMCNFYIMYWVEGDNGPIEPGFCFTNGPPDYSWIDYIPGISINTIPHIEASILD